MSAANKGVLSTARSEEGSEILTRSQAKNPARMCRVFCFKEQAKFILTCGYNKKDENCASSLGFFVWIEQIREALQS